MKTFLKILVAIVVFIVVAIFALRWMFPLPSLDGRTESTALPISAETALGAAILPAMARHPGTSGVHPLRYGPDAFAARAVLARAAEQSIDAQYYIWQTDATGLMLLDDLRQAAERGVRVRLLVDDNGVPGLDSQLAALNALPTMEVRIFNPFTLRDPKLLSYAFDFPRLNHRMHNKSFTVDGAATIVGGRNIGDIYFTYGPGVHYFDLDVVAVGTAAADVSSEFDRYWRSGSAYPAELILPASTDGLQRLIDSAADARRSKDAEVYLDAIAQSNLMPLISNGPGSLEWVPMTLVSDDPAKGLGEAEESQLLYSKLAELLSDPKRQVDLVSAYFIPGKRGTALLTQTAERGVDVRVLTNSEESTDVLPVHAAYVHYRPALLAAGVKLFELFAENANESDIDTELFLFGPSRSSLHAKTFAIDGERIFIGSFNFDPRSAELNTEMGFLIDSPMIAGELTRFMDDGVPLYAYSVRLGPNGKTEWVRTQESGEQVVYTVEPNTSAFERTIVWLLGLLPIQWML